MLNIDEVIKDLRYDAECNRADLDIDWAERNEQIADWLEELKELRAISCGYSKEDIELNRNAMYNKAIDDFVKEICKMIVQSENNGKYRFYAVEIKQSIADLTEQLKVGGENE